MKNLFLLIPLLLCSTAIADHPLHVAIVFDDSYSMNTIISTGGHTRMDVAKKALTSVIEKLPEDTHIGVLLLNDNWNHWAVPISKLNKPETIRIINDIQAKGGTPLGGCTSAAAKKILELRKTNPYSRYRLLIVTDGEADGAEGGLIDRCVPEIMQQGIAIDAIGLDMSQGHSLATKVSNYRPAQNVETLIAAISQTFAEISSDNPDFSILEGFPDDVANKIIPEMARVDTTHVSVATEAAQDTSVQSTNAPDAFFTLGSIFLIGFLSFIFVIFATIAFKALS